ncbi:Tetraacyldisaccharide 4'-kinase [Candidatus Megaera venefica]|uniref:Tetraacyldisaccharide 4'-kinase n=1 Tax=Candidatus Megaera venefica TaxID=2055910 RepID=A0ABU5NDT8_9RICK|nr:tetraacyldisaccharide 4'-kinase [Candidatus Megaera venefica]MEA0971337.1 Tetraacyldisaccharide 4'-kinase [Candidatus Megaera venefica]
MIKLTYPSFWSKKNIVSWLLIAFSWIYQLLGSLRKLLVKPVKLPCFVICIGNISVGGTGKTQLVAWLAKNLRKKNCNFLIVTKGYNSNLRGAKLVEPLDLPSDVGDESKMLSEYGQVLAAKSIKYALPIINDLKPDVVIFDDGMQNPGFFKDLTIVVIDTIRNIGNGRIFPAGPLRESVQSAINRSDIVIMIGNELCPNFSLIQTITSNNKPFFKSKIQLVGNIDTSKNYYAFTAIGDPDRFFRLLNENGINVLATKAFPDHHNYNRDEITALVKEADKQTLFLLTTKKDYVKISDHTKMLCAEVTLTFDKEEELFQLIYEKIKTYT